MRRTAVKISSAPPAPPPSRNPQSFHATAAGDAPPAFPPSIRFDPTSNRRDADHQSCLSGRQTFLVTFVRRRDLMSYRSYRYLTAIAALAVWTWAAPAQALTMKECSAKYKAA